PFLVVGVGGSTGGLEAFREVLAQLPPDPGLVFLYVQHLEPHFPSLLPEALGNPPLPVREATEGMILESDHVYVIPPNTYLAANDGKPTPAPRPFRALNMPIDHLFYSLAESHRDRAVGVVLSGGGTDGALGLKAIKGEGGITFAQDALSCRRDSMPRSAVAEGAVDYVLSPAEIARQL